MQFKSEIWKLSGKRPFFTHIRMYTHTRLQPSHSQVWCAGSSILFFLVLFLSYFFIFWQSSLALHTGHKSQVDTPEVQRHLQKYFREVTREVWISGFLSCCQCGWKLSLNILTVAVAQQCLHIFIVFFPFRRQMFASFRADLLWVRQHCRFVFYSVVFLYCSLQVYCCSCSLSSLFCSRFLTLFRKIIKMFPPCVYCHPSSFSRRKPQAVSAPRCPSRCSGSIGMIEVLVMADIVSSAASWPVAFTIETT